jgi:hypothetical protein
MPFTPYHLGPGAAFKAIGGSRFSFMIFGGSQVLMDIEPLMRILRGDAVLHGPSHTVLGVVGIALVAALVGRPISQPVLKAAHIRQPTISWPVAFASAFLGAYSHVGLDAVMHADMNALWPFAAGNSLLGVISLDALHGGCVIAGALGAAVIGFRALRDQPGVPPG